MFTVVLLSRITVCTKNIYTTVDDSKCIVNFNPSPSERNKVASVGNKVALVHVIVRKAESENAIPFWHGKSMAFF